MAVSNLASFGPLDGWGKLKEVFRLGIMMGSSSVDDASEDESHSSCNEDAAASLVLLGSSPTMIVSVLAFPLESIVKITSVRGPGIGDSWIEGRLPGCGCLMGEECPVRGRILPVVIVNIFIIA